MEKSRMIVYVKTPARLHLGLIDLRGDLGRMFGGIGVGIDHPNVILEARKADQLSVEGEKVDLTRSLASQFLKAYNLNETVEIQVKQTIPEHCGLGSGTQLALAVATALARLFKVEASPEELALAMGRGKRTGVGTAVFKHGGFVVDGGKTFKNEVRATGFSPIVFHQPFPDDWHFVVAIPEACKGLANAEEVAAFRNMPPMSAEDAGKICRLILMQLLPALLEKDIASFGEALTQIQNTVGENFSNIQGGRYSNKAIQESVEFMHRQGAYGIGQSSWGPAFYGLTKREEAERLCSKMQAFMRKIGPGKVFIAKANNRGAYIKTVKTPLLITGSKAD
jgi:beta-ribofuranosylaminobenzene 5'-phosphate synthase